MNVKNYKGEKEKVSKAQRLRDLDDMILELQKSVKFSIKNDKDFFILSRFFNEQHSQYGILSMAETENYENDIVNFASAVLTHLEQYIDDCNISLLDLVDNFCKTLKILEIQDRKFSEVLSRRYKK